MLLPIPYFHVVFTIDHRFSTLARYNPKPVFDSLFHCANDTLKQFGQRYLGGELGITAMLHTWGQTLNYHLHLHCLVTGGALTQNGRRWRAAKQDFLFPAEAVSAAFRNAFCQRIGNLKRKGTLTLASDADSFDQSLQAAQQTAWQVYIQPPMGEPAQVVEYLGRYMNRCAISNSRIIDLNNGKVTFTYKDYKDGGTQKSMTLSALEFIRRYLQHVLPKGFVRIRHYGILATQYRRTKLAAARRLLGHIVQQTATRQALLQQMFDVDPTQCDLCQQGSWQRHTTILPHPSRRKWVLALS